jgi:hypothetical protein
VSGASFERRRATAGVLALVVLVPVVMIVASCRAIFGLDDYQDSSAVLCETLTECYETRSLGECDAHVEAGLREGSVEARAGWLSGFTERACLDNCTSARRCLDLVPICNQDTCTVKEDCCGFLTGRSDCDPTAAACCRRKGIDCSDDDDCCPGAGGCSEITGTCGGVVCVPPTGVCLNDFECCTGRCEDFHCAETICQEDGFECDADLDCCTGRCDPATLKCGAPVCGLPGVLCDDASPCCDELTCYLGVCSVGECFPPGSDCVTDAQCCTDYCDPAFYLCGLGCKGDGEPCNVPEECCGNGCEEGACVSVCSTGGCETNEDCCSGNCKFGVCAPACGTPSCEHGSCETGGPLDPSCDPCSESVCAVDSYCCCVEWDSLCVTEAIGACAGVCI